MAEFRFIGDPRRNGEGPQTINAFGYSFGRDRGTEVTDAFVVKKLEGNSHFEKAAPDPTKFEISWSKDGGETYSGAHFFAPTGGDKGADTVNAAEVYEHPHEHTDTLDVSDLFEAGADAEPAPEADHNAVVDDGLRHPLDDPQPQAAPAPQPEAQPEPQAAPEPEAAPAPAPAPAKPHRKPKPAKAAAKPKASTE